VGYGVYSRATGRSAPLVAIVKIRVIGIEPPGRESEYCAYQIAALIPRQSGIFSNAAPGEACLLEGRSCAHSGIPPVGRQFPEWELLLQF